MSFREQKKYFEQLKRFERKFDRKEAETYKMLLGMHKEEEELDKLSLGKLKELHEKYYVNRPKPNLDDFFKKPEPEN